MLSCSRRAPGLAPESAVKNIEKSFPEGIPAAGADALRFTLAALAAQGRNIRLSIPRVEGYRPFANKLWNAARFALMNMTGFDADRFGDALRGDSESHRLTLADRWILSRLQRTTAEVRLAYQQKLLELNVAQAELESMLARTPSAAQSTKPDLLKNKE